MLFFGKNIVASEGEDWKKYRKIIGPLFSEPNNRLVWDEAVTILNDLFHNVWGSQKIITSDHALEITMPVGVTAYNQSPLTKREASSHYLLSEPQGSDAG